jgi:hypothetical protein
MTPRQTLKGVPAGLAPLVAAALGGDDLAALALSDWLRENGHGPVADAVARAYPAPNLAPDFPRARFAAAMVAETFRALAFHAALEAVDPARVPVMSGDRRIPRKQQAALARRLFCTLKLPHVSVTTPSYSMASSVHVDLPRRRDHAEYDGYGLVAIGSDPAARANRRAVDLTETILANAFPEHDDRSDSLSDYFDFKWSIHG